MLGVLRDTNCINVTTLNSPQKLLLCNVNAHNPHIRFTTLISQVTSNIPYKTLYSIFHLEIQDI